MYNQKIMLRISFILVVSVMASLPMVAQTIPDPGTPQGENLKVPEGWEFRLDRPDESVSLGEDPETADIYFVNMTPGWHLTTGPRAIFYHPNHEVSGDYSIHTNLYLFNPNGRNREGYGLFFGGQDLKADSHEYLYFLIRNTGDFLIKRRVGESTELVQDWTKSDAIVIYDDPEVSSVLNKLVVEVSGSMMIFHINGEKVAEIDASELELETDGIFGLRVNHSVNLHVEDLGIGAE